MVWLRHELKRFERFHFSNGSVLTKEAFGGHSTIEYDARSAQNISVSAYHDLAWLHLRQCGCNVITAV